MASSRPNARPEPPQPQKMMRILGAHRSNISQEQVGNYEDENETQPSSREITPLSAMPPPRQHTHECQNQKYDQYHSKHSPLLPCRIRLIRFSTQLFYLWLDARVSSAQLTCLVRIAHPSSQLPIRSLVSGHCGEETAYSENRHELHETILFSPRAWASAAGCILFVGSGGKARSHSRQVFL